jgi:hypothetical protein
MLFNYRRVLLNTYFEGIYNLKWNTFLIEVRDMTMSEYYKELRKKIGTELIFSPSVAVIIRNEQVKFSLCLMPSVINGAYPLVRLYSTKHLLK